MGGESHAMTVPPAVMLPAPRRRPPGRPNAIHRLAARVGNWLARKLGKSDCRDFAHAPQLWLRALFNRLTNLAYFRD